MTFLIVPFYKNSDVHRYATKTITDSYILYLDRSIKDISSFVPIKKHLEKFKGVLSKRREVENGVINYFQLQWPRDQSIFKDPKIVAPQRSSRNTFGYNECAWYASADVYFITRQNQQISLKYILGLLNSRLYYFWLYHRGKRKGETLELYQKPLSELPIKNAPKTIQDIIEQLVDRRIQRVSKGENSELLERQINQEIYTLYNLTSEEIKVVESCRP